MFDWTGWTLEEPEVADSSKYDMMTPSVVRPRCIDEDDVSPQVKELEVWYLIDYIADLALKIRKPWHLYKHRLWYGMNLQR
jgi:hypothetical protein